MTRRNLFATLLAPLVAKFARKPETMMGTAYKDAGHIFYNNAYGAWTGGIELDGDKWANGQPVIIRDNVFKDCRGGLS